MLALLIPGLAGTWAFAELAARREVARVDARLRASLGAAIDEYGDALDEAQRRARALASAPAVQEALADADRPDLARLQRRHPGVRLLTHEQGTPAADALRTVDVYAGGQRVGRVVVPIRIDDELLGRLRRRAALGPNDRITLVRELDVLPGVSRPSYITLGGIEYRALATALRRSDPRITLAVLRDRGAVEAAAADVRNRILAVGGVALACVATLAYLFAPALARTRLRRRQRAQAERVLSLLSDGVLEVDDDGVVTYINPAAAALAGVDPDDVLGRPAGAAMPGWQEIQAATSPGESSAVPIELGGREHWLSVAAVAADGGTVYAFRDVTRERRLEEMRAELVATVSHELRTPLAAVYGAAMTLQRATNVDEATRQQLIGVVGNQADRLARIVDDILTASRAAVEADEESAAPVDARAVAETAVHDAAERTGRPIELDADDEPLVALGREDDVRRVLGNLLDNAVKYSPAGTPVHVRLERENGSVRLVVSDHGVGIPRDEQERIFERFYRLDPGMASGVGGTGLGLYIARRLAEQMGGHVTVSSSPGEGADFSLVLRSA